MASSSSSWIKATESRSSLIKDLGITNLETFYDLIYIKLTEKQLQVTKNNINLIGFIMLQELIKTKLQNIYELPTTPDDIKKKNN